MRKYQIGIVQLSSGEDKKENLNRICGYIQEAAENGARLVVLTENMNVITKASLPVSDFAEDESGGNVPAHFRYGQTPWGLSSRRQLGRKNPGRFSGVQHQLFVFPQG